MFVWDRLSYHNLDPIPPWTKEDGAEWERLSQVRISCLSSCVSATDVDRVATTPSSSTSAKTVALRSASFSTRNSYFISAQPHPVISPLHHIALTPACNPHIRLPFTLSLSHTTFPLVPTAASFPP